jgi:hypothetical protein
MAAETVGIDVTEFAGLLTNRGDYSGPPGGAEVQENVTIVAEGELRVRQGLRPVSFEN